MAKEEKLLELLRRAHIVIGEGLIENALDEFAEGLHNEIADVLGLPKAKRDTVRCGAKWFVAGGRMERQCRENAEQVCAECGAARCAEHEDISFEEIDGRILCEDCNRIWREEETMTHAKKATHAPDVLIANAGTVFVFCPLTFRAKEWIDEHARNATWYGDALIVEHRFAWGLARGMKNAGLELK